jgi:hypothetical protein
MPRSTAQACIFLVFLRVLRVSAVKVLLDFPLSSVSSVSSVMKWGSESGAKTCRHLVEWRKRQRLDAACAAATAE